MKSTRGYEQSCASLGFFAALGAMLFSRDLAQWCLGLALVFVTTRFFLGEDRSARERAMTFWGAGLFVVVATLGIPFV